MRYIGRFLGLLTGLVIFPNLFTALFGFALGAVFDFTAQRSRTRLALDEVNQELCLTFLRLAAAVAMVGRTPQTAWQALKPGLDGTPFNLAIAEQQFRQAQRQPDDISVIAGQMIDSVAENRQQLSMILETLYYMSRRQGPSPAQQRLLHRMSEFFDVDLPEEEPQAERVHHRPPPPESESDEPAAQPKPEPEQAHPHKSDALAGRNPYVVLGINTDATEAQIKSAYRKLVAKHHPDKLRGQGASAKALHEAEEKMRVYNAAYDILAKRQKG